MLLSALNMARGQTSYTYRYWTDNNAAGVVTGTATGEKSFDVDISNLSVGLHTLHLQAQSNKGVLSSVQTQFFAKMGGTTAATGQYWFDNDATSKKTVAGTGTISIDASALSTGLHALHFHTLSSDGVPSSVQTQFFVKLADNKNVKAQYWFDNDATTLHTVETMNSTIDIDVSELEPGLHAIHFQTISADGILSAVRTEYLYIKANILAKIWIDSNTADTKTYVLTGDPIVIDVRKLSVGMHKLTVTLINPDGQTIGTQTVEFEVEPRMKTITLTAELMAFSCDEDLDFTGTKGLRAYTAAGFNKKSNDVNMYRVNDAPAGTGLLLRGKAGTYEVLCTPSDSYYANLLVATLEDTPLTAEADGYVNYVLAMEDGKVGFSKATNGSVSYAESAYLRIPSGEATDASRLNIVIVSDEPGDVNNDYVVDVADIASIISVMAGDATVALAIAADVNDDGVVDVADIATVIGIMAENARRAEDLTVEE
jgi:methionine-rich copper-binding protein CopC